MAVKVDGPTKEQFVWGFRTGMLTFGARAFLSDEALYQADSGKYDSYSDEELYRMIDEAIKTEDYERAASLRDEIEKRKKL